MNSNTPSGESTEKQRPEYPETLLNQAAQAPGEPGVYLMKNAQGRILYVGKARDLRKRLKSYFFKGRTVDPKTWVLLSQVARVETTVTHTEQEALILESNLIKRHRPRYNVVLKDDKRYPSLRLNTNHPYPNLNVVRKVKNDGALYFGPYASGLAVKQTLKFIHKTFKLRKCRVNVFMNRTRPCLNYQMGLCLAPCCLGVDRELYNDIVKEVVAFLKGRTPDLISQMRQKMISAADAQDYEVAADLRDKVFALQKTLEKQVSVTNDFKDRDAVGIVSDAEMLMISVLQVRAGFLMGERRFSFSRTFEEIPEQVGGFLRQYYNESHAVPAEILISSLPADNHLVAVYLAAKRGSRVNLLAPRRGEKHRLVQMAVQNAQQAMNEHLLQEATQLRLLTRLREKLGLQHEPRRIECFDNSNLQGTQPVSAMVVFYNGQSLPAEYRRYKVSVLGKPDDYAHMLEVVRRRYGKGEASLPFPDLLIVDGGKGQVNVALSALAGLNLLGSFAVIGIAKKDPVRGEKQDKVYLAGRSNAVNFGRDDDLLLFLQRIRDEAHRWAVSFQRQRRRKHALDSRLDQISGIGPQRRAALLREFGSVENIKSASEAKLRAVPGISAALSRVILERLNKDPG